MEWTAALNKAIRYMESHLSQSLTVEEIARECSLSPSHFQRAFSLLTGMTPGEYLRSRRLSLAGEEILSGASVLDTALRYGYESPESFSKAFRRFHGVSPQGVKKTGAALRAFSPLQLKVTLEGGKKLIYKLQKKPAFSILALTRSFSWENNFSGIPTFWDEYLAAGLGEQVPGQFGVCLPPSHEASHWEYGIGCEQSLIVSRPKGFRLLSIPAHTWAVFPCRGSLPQTMQSLWKQIYSEWLPQTGYEFLPDCEVELYTEGDAADPSYYSEIWIPIKERSGDPHKKRKEDLP